MSNTNERAELIEKLRNGQTLIEDEVRAANMLEADATRITELESSLDFYQRRVELLQKWQSKMRDPERTIACDIIANGQTLPPENAGDRYKIPVEAQQVAVHEVSASLKSMVEMMNSGDEHGEGSDWHLKATAALAKLAAAQGVKQ